MNSLLDPAVLFFAFGVLAGVLRSDLEIPPQVSKFLSLYLLMALGLKGGFALAASGWTADAVAAVEAELLLERARLLHQCRSQAPAQRVARREP
jgi:hypothetical protein